MWRMLEIACRRLASGMPIMALTYFRSALALKLDRRAVTAIEYAIIASLVSITIVVALTSIGGDIKTTFGRVASEL
jgi:pilus assembly protein Flp/PilA